MEEEPYDLENFEDIPPLPDTDEDTATPAAHAAQGTNSVSPARLDNPAADATQAAPYNDMRGTAPTSAFAGDLLKIAEAVLKVQNASTDSIVGQTAAALGTDEAGQAAIVSKLLAGAKRSREDIAISTAAISSTVASTTQLGNRAAFTKFLMDQAVRQHSVAMDSVRSLANLRSMDIERQAASASLAQITGGVSAVAAQRTMELNPNNAAYVIAMAQMQAIEQTQQQLVLQVAEVTKLSAQQLVEIAQEKAALQSALANERQSTAIQKGLSESLQVQLVGYNAQLAALETTLAKVSAESEASREAAAKYQQEVAINRALEQHLDLKGIATAVIKANAPAIMPQNVPAPNALLRKAAPTLFAVRFMQHKNCSISELVADWEEQTERRQQAEGRVEQLEADRQTGLRQVAATLVALKEEILRRQSAEKWVERHSLERIPPNGHDSARRELAVVYAELSNAKDEIARLKVNATERKMSRDALVRKQAELEQEVEALTAATHSSELVQSVAAAHAAFAREQQRLTDALNESLTNAHILELAVDDATRGQAAATAALAASEGLVANVSQQLGAMTLRAQRAEKELVDARKDIAVQLRQVTQARTEASAKAAKISTDIKGLPLSVISHMQSTEKLLQRLVSSVAEINTSPVQRGGDENPTASDVRPTDADGRVHVLQQIVTALASRLIGQAQRTDLVQSVLASQMQSDLQVRDELLAALADQQRLNETTIRSYEAIIDKHGLQAGESLLQQDPTTSSEALGKIRSVSEQEGDGTSSAHRAEEMLALQRSVADLQARLNSKTFEAEAQAAELSHMAASVEVHQRILSNTGSDLDKHRAMNTALQAEIEHLRTELDSERARLPTPVAEAFDADGTDNARAEDSEEPVGPEALQHMVTSVTDAIHELTAALGALPSQGISEAELAQLEDPHSAQRAAVGTLLQSFADMKKVVADAFGSRAAELSAALALPTTSAGDGSSEAGDTPVFDAEAESSPEDQDKIISYAARRLRLAAPAPATVYVEPTEELLKAMPLYRDIAARLESLEAEHSTQKEKITLRNAEVGNLLKGLKMVTDEKNALLLRVAELEKSKAQGGLLQSPPMQPVMSSPQVAPLTPLDAPKTAAPFAAPAKAPPSSAIAAAAAAATNSRPKGTAAAAAAAAAASRPAPPQQPSTQGPSPFGAPPQGTFGQNAFVQQQSQSRGRGNGRGGNWRGAGGGNGW